MFSTRQNKVSRLIQKDLGTMFTRESFDLPVGAMITITTVRITGDLKIAKIYISVFPANKAGEIINHLNLVKNQIRYSLGKKIRHQLKEVPEIHFFQDDSLDYIDNIENLLDK
jgi:ribosome-binding factor A